MPGEPSQPDALDARLADLIVREVAYALGFKRQGALPKLIALLIRRQARRLAQLAAAFDADVAASGFGYAADRLARQFVESYRVHGEALVPPEGPLLIASNHPGVSDALIIAAALPRNDAKLVVSDVPLTRALPNAESKVFIPVSGEPNDRVQALRTLLDHLNAGNAVIIFPSTHLTPDPALAMAEVPDTATLEALCRATFEDWSASLLLALRRVPGCAVQPTIVSGVLAARFYRHPLVRLLGPRVSARPGEGWKRQRLAEFLQVLAQIKRKDCYGLTPRITFGEPLNARDLGDVQDQTEAMRTITDRGKAVLAEHVKLSGDGIIAANL